MIHEVLKTANPSREICIARDGGLMAVYTRHNGCQDKWNTLRVEDVEARQIARVIQAHFPQDSDAHCFPSKLGFWLSLAVNVVLFIVLLWPKIIG